MFTTRRMLSLPCPFSKVHVLCEDELGEVLPLEPWCGERGRKRNPTDPMNLGLQIVSVNGLVFTGKS